MVPISPTTCKVRTATITVIQQAGVVVVPPAGDGEEDQIALVPPAAFMCVPPPPTPSPAIQRFALTAATLNTQINSTKKSKVVDNTTVKKPLTVEMQITDVTPTTTQLTEVGTSSFEEDEDGTTRKEIAEDSNYLSQVSLFGSEEAKEHNDENLQMQQTMVRGCTEIDSPSSLFENQIDGIEEDALKRVPEKLFSEQMYSLTNNFTSEFTNKEEEMEQQEIEYLRLGGDTDVSGRNISSHGYSLGPNPM